MNFKDYVVYQIWPRSFYDSNNDGIGDINGIIAKLPYLHELGITLLWLSPIYSSPNDDYGYDISDYYSIHPDFGTMDDFKRLIQTAKEYNIDILMDLVANHTSSSHEWFQKALQGDEYYREFYYFRRGTESSPPNNWMGFFGGSTWQKERDDIYYLTTFAPTQVDLNWNNPNVRQEIYKVMKYYLDMGVAGFRMDVINTIDKKEGLPDYHPERKGLQFPNQYIIDGPMVEEYLKEMRSEVLDPYHALALGECVLVSKEKAMNYTNPANKELDMTFHFDLAMLGYGELGKYDPRKLYHFTISDIKDITRKWQNAMQEQDGYIGNYLSNHDHKRHTRFYNYKKYPYEGATAFAVYNFTLYGTPFIYQGEEIGMTNPRLKRKDWKDYEAFSSTKTLHDMLHIPMYICDLIGTYVTRDNARTPICWNGQNNAGFTKGIPWIPINPDYTTINIEKEMNDEHSIWNFYKKLIELRKKSETLRYGTYQEVLAEHKAIIGYMRKYKNDKVLILINLSDHKQTYALDIKVSQCIISNYEFSSLNNMLRPYEAVIFMVKTN